MIISLLIATIKVNGQGENYNWLFGNGAYLTFTCTGAPTPKAGSPMLVEEGSSSISDAAGNLLFYTDGAKVWDKNHNQMPNGFGLNGGGGSSTQACIILKQPGNANIYYIFTVDQDAGPSGFRYSTVDMTLNTGLGDVVVKNTLIHNQTSEKIAATYHCNGTDIWVATHDIGSDLYRAVLLSSAGVGAAVTSAIGPVLSGVSYAGMGTIKFSPDGTKAAMCNMNTNVTNYVLDLLDFNKSTGVFSNRRDIYSSGIEPYGIEFSPNGNLLYISDLANVEYLQYDISSGIAATIVGSKLSIGTCSQGNPGQLELGQDGKIYTTQTRTSFIGAINSPNTAGVGCNWSEFYIDMDVPALGNIDIRFGLPSQLKYIPTQFTYPNSSYCISNPVTPTPTFCSPYPSAGIFSSSAGLSINSSTGIINLAASTPGTYTVTYGIPFTGCATVFKSNFVVNISPNAIFSQSVSGCQGYSITAGTNTYSVTGIYNDTLTGAAAGGCDSVITTNLTIHSIPTFTQSFTSCQGFSVTVGTNTYTTTGTYNDTLIAATTNGCDSIVITNLTINPIATFTQSFTNCQGFSVTVGTNTYTTTGIYNDTLTAAASNGCDSIITTDLTIYPVPTFTQSFTGCPGYNISVGTNTYTATGIYTNTLTGAAANGCDSIVTTNLTIFTIPTFTQSFTNCLGFNVTVGPNTYSTTGTYIDTLTGAAANSCDSIIITNLTITTPSVSVQSFNECEGFSVIVGTNTYSTTGSYTDIIGCDTVFTTLNIFPSVSFNVLKTDDNCNENIGSIEVTSTTGTPPYNYYWNSVSGNSLINNLSAGQYTLLLVDSNGCEAADTVHIEDLSIHCDYSIFIPNVFSPNGDGQNDMLFVYGKGIKTFNLKIYDRWGNLVFESDDIAKGWDGKYKGMDEDTSVFAYSIEVRFNNEKEVVQKGNISLVR